jgi:hypothetical protein
MINKQEIRRVSSARVIPSTDSYKSIRCPHPLRFPNELVRSTTLLRRKLSVPETVKEDVESEIESILYHGLLSPKGFSVDKKDEVTYGSFLSPSPGPSSFESRKFEINKIESSPIQSSKFEGNKLESSSVEGNLFESKELGISLGSSLGSSSNESYQFESELFENSKIEKTLFESSKGGRNEMKENDVEEREEESGLVEDDFFGNHAPPIRSSNPITMNSPFWEDSVDEIELGLLSVSPPLYSGDFERKGRQLRYLGLDENFKIEFELQDVKV